MDEGINSMWERLMQRLRSGSKPENTTKPPSLQAAMKALDESAAEAPKPTLVFRQCGLKYENTGTFLQGSRCPVCYPNA